MRDPMLLVGYILGVVMVVVGLLILGGVISSPEVWSPTLKTIFGLIVLLFGIYRIAVTETKRRRGVADLEE